MKHLKYFEDTIEADSIKPQIGDYVIMKTSQDNIKEYISTHIGQIQYINKQSVLVKYENVPDNLIKLQIFDYEKLDTKIENYNVRTFSTNQIITHAPTIEELQAKLLKDKYNL